MGITFAKSERSTLGIEWELQLIDKDSFDLRQCASTILEEVERLHPDNGLVHREMLLNTVEIISRPRHRVRDCVIDLIEGINLVRPVTSALRVELASVSYTHLDVYKRQVVSGVRLPKDGISLRRS